MMQTHRVQPMKKASFYHFILPKAQDHLEVVEEEDVKPIVLAGGKIQEPARLRDPIPRLEVEISGNLKLLPLFPWEIKKTLSGGDVSGGHGSEGLRLSSEQVHNHILKHWMWEDEWFIGTSEPVLIRDLDTNTIHALLLRKWDAFQIYTIQNSWLDEFVIRRRLSQGTLIGMYWDIKRFCLCFSVLSLPS